MRPASALNPNDADLWPVPVQILGRFAEELRARGVDGDAVSAAFAPLDGVLGTPDATLPYDEVVAIIDAALALVDAPDGLGVHVGTRAHLADWGVLGFAVACCSTLGEAFRLAPRYYRAAPGLTRLGFDEAGDTAVLTAALPRELGRVGRFAIEEDFSGILQVAASLTGAPIPLREVRFAYAAPAQRAIFDRSFAGPVVFDAGVNQVVFDLEVMALPLRHSSPFSKASATALCDQFLQRHPTGSTLSARVRHMLVGSGLRLRQEGELARSLSLSPRSLRRQLAVEGQTFQRILDATREEIACQLLVDEALKIEDIAQRLGYSDARTFRRAFKQWMGASPAEWRASR